MKDTKLERESVVDNSDPQPFDTGTIAKIFMIVFRVVGFIAVAIVSIAAALTILYSGGRDS
ncbi:hypothetical protein Dpep_2380 [Dethiosulfovibrio peptidovorans DSM 11002]|uniref:Uncharacterized protein n=1 Tax=Dethiosulfovibrio peptidovorans DSM 11002 TaxID=469381 RepID=D2Z4Q8_9BACT|nr:hypothetical protein [Dethiosulfovibrio peptidovorans]EFC92402.1 hypothetical protein Dpep_2380 [Dethiosulfovibrio peptidovorans DSM 11002]